MGNTPLMVCAMNGFCDIARLLIGQGANVKCTNKNGDSPLILSITNSGSSNMIELLLAQKDIDLFHKNSQGFTFLMKAVEHINLAAIVVIFNVERQRTLSDTNKELFKKLITEAEAFAERYVVPTFLFVKQEILENKSSIVAAATKTDLESVKFLISAGFLTEANVLDIISEILTFYQTKGNGLGNVDIEIMQEIIFKSRIRQRHIPSKHFWILSKAVYAGNCKLLDLICQFVNKTFFNLDLLYCYGTEAAFGECRIDMLNILKKSDKFCISYLDKEDLLSEAIKRGDNAVIHWYENLMKI